MVQVQYNSHYLVLEGKEKDVLKVLPEFMMQFELLLLKFVATMD